MEKTVIINAKVFDGNTLSEPKPIAIESGLISASAEGGNVIDGTGCTLLPGLIDCHIHLDLAEHLHMCAINGVTTALDMGSRTRELVDSMKGLEGACNVLSCYLPAFAPGSKLFGTMHFPEQSEIKDIDDAKRHVSEQVSFGADYIKIIIEEKGINNGVEFPAELLAALVDEAHKHNKKAIAHVVTAGTYASAIKAGVDILTHIPFIKPLPSKTIDDIVANGIVCIPTMIVMKTIVSNIKKHVPIAPVNFKHVRKTVSALYKSGATFFTGTDANCDTTVPGNVPYGSGMFDELSLFAEAKIPPIQALQRATSKPAEYFGLTDRGVISPGKRADLLLVEGDPVADIADIRNVKRVWIGGAEVMR